MVLCKQVVLLVEIPLVTQGDRFRQVSGAIVVEVRQPKASDMAALGLSWRAGELGDRRTVSANEGTASSGARWPVSRAEICRSASDVWCTRRARERAA